MRELYVIVHNMRSTFNVGSLFRTSEGLGVKKLFLTGYTPYPKMKKDVRLPHISEKLARHINKTALGAIETLDWEYKEDIFTVLDRLEQKGIIVAALEQTNQAVLLSSYRAPDKLALVLGTEVTGIPSNVLDRISTHLFIPMIGKKESFNVVQAAAMALYEFQFH